MSDYILRIYFMIRMFLFPSQRTQSVSLQRPCWSAYEHTVINLSWISLTPVLNMEAVDSAERLVATRKAAWCLKTRRVRSVSRKCGLDCAAWLQDRKRQLICCLVMNRMASLTRNSQHWKSAIQPFDKCVLLGYYSVSNDNYRRFGTLSVPSLRFRNPRSLRTGSLGCPETSVRNYDYWPRNNGKERSCQLLRGGNLKSPIQPVIRLFS